MFDAAVVALEALLDPARLQWLVIGVAVGLVIGALPGLGGVAGMAILIPFIYGMDPYSGIALLVGMMAVTSTSDTFLSILMGVPGSSSSQATIVDGYPMARKGLGGVALGASFTASMLGGVLGAVALFALLPVAKPLVLALKAPELLMLSLLGVSMVAVLSRRAPLAGLIAAALGLFLSAVGPAPAGGDRFLFGWDYLYGGIPITILALGLFAVPEFIDLVVEGRSIAKSPTGGSRFGADLFKGAWEAIRRIYIVIWGGLVGIVFGLLPGIGGSVSQWVVYGTTTQIARKDRDNFGKGDVRGVIAPESANNSGDAGTLVPTLLFGIPGNGSTAVMLGGLLLLGINVGPEMLNDQNLPLVLTVTWTLAIANILATAACFVTARWMLKLSLVPSRTFIPFMFIIVILAAYQSNKAWGDVLLVFVIGTLGWVMKRLGWPRPPLLVAFVLGATVERYLRISMGRYEWEWMTRPSVLVIAAIIAVVVFFAVRRKPPAKSLQEALKEGS